MKSKYLSTISKLVYLVTLILLFIISKKIFRYKNLHWFLSWELIFLVL